MGESTASMVERLRALEAERDELRGAIERLERMREQLLSARDEFEHQARRGGDALQRAGGASRDIEQRLGLLGENLKLTDQDLERGRRELEGLGSRLETVVSEIERLRSG